MNLSKYLLIGLGVLSLHSCDDFLGNKPKGYTIPEKFEDYSKLLNSSYLMSSSNTVLAYLTDDLYRTSNGEIMNENDEGKLIDLLTLIFPDATTMSVIFIHSSTDRF